MNRFPFGREGRGAALVVAVLALALFPHAGYGAASFGTRVLSATPECQLNDVAANGQVAVVALVGTAATDPRRRCPVSAAVRTVTTWAPAQTIAPRGNSDIAAAVGPNGDAALAWYDAGGRLQVAVRPAAGPRFATAENPPGSRSADRTLRRRDPPGLAVDGAGTAYVVTEDLVVNVRSREGAWTQDTGARDALNDVGALPTLEPGDLARVGVAANAVGDLVIGSANFRDDELFAPRVMSRRAGGTWGIGMIGFEMADRPAVGIDGLGTITAAWAQNEPSTGVFRAEGAAGGALSRGVRVVDLSSLIPGRTRQVDLAVAESGAAVLTTLYGATAAVHKPAGGDWGAPASVSVPGSVSSSIDAGIDPRGAAAVMAGVHVFTHASGAGRWSRPWRVTAEDDGGGSLVAVDGSGRVVPVWERDGSIVTTRRTLSASDTRGNVREASPARLLSAVPFYRNGDPKRCYDALIRAVQRNPGRSIDPRRCAPGVAVRIRNDGPAQRASVRVDGAEFDLKLAPGTRRYVLRPLRGGPHRVWLVVASVPGAARRVRLRGCPGPFC